MRPVLKGIFDLSKPDTKRRIMASIGTMTGAYEIELKPRRDTRTLRQNAFYWAGVVQPFYEFLRGQDYEITDPEQAHALAKEKFLRVSVMNTETGEVLGFRTRSTTELSVEEMTDYIDRVRTWLNDQFGIITLDPAEHLAGVAHI